MGARKRLMTKSLYDPGFYAEQSAASKQSARAVLERAWPRFAPVESVVDVGGGVGTWLAICHELGATSTTLVEGPWVRDATQVFEPTRVHLQDLEEPLAPIGKFSLAMCLEVAEHLSEARAHSLVADLTRLSDQILFSAALPGQTGVGHVNEQWLTYWVRLFQQFGFEFEDTIRPAIWEDKSVEWWYRQNVVIFRKSSNVGGSQPDSPIDIVHPCALAMYAPERTPHPGRTTPRRRFARRLLGLFR